MEPTEWHEAWKHPLIRASANETRLPPEAHSFLTVYGLPEVMIFECQTDFEISFSPLREILKSYNKLIRWGDMFNEKLDGEWSHQLVIGEEEFCNGHASFCVHDRTGIVYRLDCEVNDHTTFVNSTVAKFGMSLLAAKIWSDEILSAGVAAVEFLDVLGSRVSQIDPIAFSNDVNFWPSLIECVRESESPDLEVTSDPKRSKPRF